MTTAARQRRSFTLLAMNTSSALERFPVSDAFRRPLCNFVERQNQLALLPDFQTLGFSFHQSCPGIFDERKEAVREFLNPLHLSPGDGVGWY